MPLRNLPLALVCLFSGAPLAWGQSARPWPTATEAQPRPGGDPREGRSGHAERSGYAERSSHVVRPAAFEATSGNSAKDSARSAPLAPAADDPHREIGGREAGRKPGGGTTPPGTSEKSRSTGPLVT